MIGATFTLDFDTALIGSKVMEAVSAGVAAGAAIVQDEAQSIVHVRSGALHDSIQAQPPTLNGTVATAEVTAGTDHSFFVEYGTGRRGEASAGAGPGPYDAEWPGMEAIPYLRPALDNRRDDVFAAIAQEVQGAL